MGEGKEKRKVEERLPERSGENNRDLMTRRLCPVTNRRFQDQTDL